MFRYESPRELCTITSYETRKIVCMYKPRVRVKVDLATVKHATYLTSRHHVRLRRPVWLRRLSLAWRTHCNRYVSIH